MVNSLSRLEKRDAAYVTLGVDRTAFLHSVEHELGVLGLERAIYRSPASRLMGKHQEPPFAGLMDRIVMYQSDLAVQPDRAMPLPLSVCNLGAAQKFHFMARESKKLQDLTAADMSNIAISASGLFATEVVIRRVLERELGRTALLPVQEESAGQANWADMSPRQKNIAYRSLENAVRSRDPALMTKLLRVVQQHQNDPANVSDEVPRSATSGATPPVKLIPQ